MADSASATCQNCAFWKFTPARKQSDIHFEIGFCRKSAPITSTSDMGIVNNWPYTSADAWCGEWAKK